VNKILVLFPNEWDRFELSRRRPDWRFILEGFDLFRFPENARLLAFNAPRFINYLVRKYRRENLAGVVSTDEHFGSMIAALVAEELELPGAPLAPILTAQHKYYARRLEQRLAPEATPRFSLFRYSVRDEAEAGLEFPCFVKPARATFSILARRVGSFAELRRHLRFGPLEKLILKRLITPFNDLAARHTDFEIDAHYFIGEEILEGAQVTLEGFVCDDKVEVLGIVDSIMFPGTDAFRRFEYPSNLPDNVQARMSELAERLIRGFNYTHGLFNVEFFWRPETDTITIIELNLRMAYQFADFYEKVDGYNSYDVLLALGAGQRPVIRRRQGAYNHAASFVFRTFDGSAPRSFPDQREVRRIEEQHDARLKLYVRRGASLAREMKWMGSHRYALLNLGAASRAELFERFHHVRCQLPPEFTTLMDSGLATVKTTPLCHQPQSDGATAD
jgi:biotin carboxylase